MLAEDRTLSRSNCATKGRKPTTLLNRLSIFVRVDGAPWSRSGSAERERIAGLDVDSTPLAASLGARQRSLIVGRM